MSELKAKIAAILKPAPNYEGKAQMGTFGAIVRKMVAEKLCSTSSYDTNGRLPEVTYRKGRIYRPGLSAEAVEVHVSAGRSVRHNDAQGSRDADGFAKALKAALLDAGWTVEEGSSSRTLIVFGPGMRSWLADIKIADRERENSRKEAALQKEMQKEMLALVAKHLGCGAVTTDPFMSPVLQISYGEASSSGLLDAAIAVKR